MKKMIFAAAAFCAVSLLSLPGRAQDQLRYQPEPDFNLPRMHIVINRMASALSPTNEALPSNAAQSALDRCILPMVVRKVESGADFIRYYGGCLNRAPELKIKALKQSPGHRLGVLVLSAAEKPALDRLNGSVSVNTETGPVKVLLMAYSETVYLP